MSTEQFDPRSENQNNDTVVEDPLEELARIVSGEAETEPVVATPSALPEEQGDASLETHLMEELAAEQSVPEEPDDYAASIQEQLEAQLAADSTLEISEPSIEMPEMNDAVATSADVEPPEMPAEPVDEETAFQDDLIEALQEEIAPPQPVMETNTAEIHDTVSLEDTLDAVLQEPLTEELSVAGVPESDVAAFEVPIDEVALAEPEHFQVEEADLDMPPPVVEPFVEAAATEALEPTPEMPASEIDFSSAFAEELGVEAVEEAQGWEVNNDAAQADEFALAAQSAGYQPVEDSGVPAPEHMGAPEAELAAMETDGDQSSGGGMKYAMAALIIALFAGVITAGYGFLGGGSGNEQVAEEATIIKADAEPVKVKPENPGGRIPDNQDKASYGKVEGIEEEVDQSTLLSNTEQPALIDTSNVTPEALEQAQSSLTAADINSNKIDDRLSGGAEPEASGVATNSSVAPKRVKTLVIKPDGTVIDKPLNAQLGGSQQFAASSSDLGLTQVADAKPIQVSTTSVKPNEPIDGAQSSQAIGVPAASPLPKPVAEQPKPAPVQQVATTQTQQTQSQPVARSEWVVQVASQTSPEAAQASFQKMRQQFSILQNRSMSVQRAAVNGKTYFRVRVQTASRSDANQLCSQLTSQGGNCFVTR